MSTTAYSIYSHVPFILEAVPPSATWGCTMPWWQGHEHTSSKNSLLLGTVFSMCIIIQNTECFSWILILTFDTFRNGKVSPITCGGMLLWRLNLCGRWAIQSHKQHWSDKIRSLYIRNFVCRNAWTCKYFKEQYPAFQNVLFILLVNKHSNASKSATGSTLMSASCKVFTIDTHKSVAFLTT